VISTLKKTCPPCLVLIAALLFAQTALAAQTTVGGTVSRGESDSMAYSLDVTQSYEPWISNEICQLAPLAELGGHAWTPDDSDDDTVWGAHLGVGVRFTLFTNKILRPFLEGTVGGAVNSEDNMGPRDLGSNVLFRTRGAVGLNFGESYQHTVRGDVVHHTTWGLTNTDDGYTNYGLSYGYSF